jgi:nicotinamide-nucleotide amidase
MVMQPNNRKQALLPSTADIIDNPIGTACGFELTIGRARFYFTPGVPRELYLMLDEQILPKLLARNGTPTSALVKRFHTFGLGESHVDALLEGVEELAPDRSVKLGFQTHYPELETKLTVRGPDPSELQHRVEPIAVEVRRRLGNFIVAEDDETVEGIVLTTLARTGASLAVAETVTAGQIAARLAQAGGSETVLRRGLVTPAPSALEAALGLAEGSLSGAHLTEAAASDAARALIRVSGATHALVALAEPGDDAGAPNAVPTMWYIIAAGDEVHIRQNRLRFGDPEWLRSGSAEMALDSLRRHLQGLPITEMIDFEKRG